jgi:hypothetical protein
MVADSGTGRIVCVLLVAAFAVIAFAQFCAKCSME